MLLLESICMLQKNKPKDKIHDIPGIAIIINRHISSSNVYVSNCDGKKYSGRSTHIDIYIHK